MQGDRVFLTVFVTLLVGLVTAALSIVRLVNDKEGKTSDHRQNWCNSLRTCLAELVTHINSTASLIVNHHQYVDGLNGIFKKNEEQAGPWPEGDGVVRTHYMDRFGESEEKIYTLRRELFQSLAFLKLHFKPNEPLFIPIEKDVQIAVSGIRAMMKMRGPNSKSELISQRDEIHKISDQIMEAGRGILKIEWEIVKKGERAYEYTKQGSLIGGGAALAILFILGSIAFWSLVSPGADTKPLDKSTNSGAVQEAPNPKGGLTESSISQVVNVNPVAFPTPAEKSKIIYIDKKVPCKEQCKSTCLSPSDIVSNENSVSSAPICK